jgi:hypothetical protein
MIHQVNELLFNTLGDAPDVPRVLVGCMKDLAVQRQVNQIVSLSHHALSTEQDRNDYNKIFMM